MKQHKECASRLLKIGTLEIWPGRMDSDHVWIQETSGGEGGDFKIAELAAVIEKFYSENL